MVLVDESNVQVRGRAVENVRFFKFLPISSFGSLIVLFLDFKYFRFNNFLVLCPDWLSNFNCWMSTEMTHFRMSNFNSDVCSN